MLETEQDNRGDNNANADRENGRNPQHTPVTHERFMGSLNFLERFLLFMAKTELFVLQYCTQSTRMILTSVGAMVVITGTLAFCSSFFTFKTCFFNEDLRPIAFIVSFIAASVYAIAIMAFDREIVGAGSSKKSWWTTSLRIVFAIFIGIAISFPIELILQHGKISAEIKLMAEEKNNDKTNVIGELTKSKLTLADEAIKPLQEKSKTLDRQIKQELASVDSEAMVEHGLCRERCNAHKDNAATFQKEFERVSMQIRQERASVENSPAYRKYVEQIKALELEKYQDEKNSYDLLSQAVALHRIKKNSDYGTTATTMGWFILGFFICFELFPVIIKMTMPYTEYHAYQEARNLLLTTKLILASNQKLAYFRDNPDKIIGDNTEITDMLVELLEDREIDINKTKESHHV